MELRYYKQQITTLETVEKRIVFFADLLLSQREDNAISSFRRIA